GLDPDEFRDYRAVTGQVTSGRIRLGDEIDVHPAGLRTTVVGIDTADGARAVARGPAGGAGGGAPRLSILMALG
ncbi:MAG: hypothetical protein L0J13_05695, partial [Brevibacterium sp.]|nr:hypothetical protein [Brevibacterium sp.]